MSDAARRHLRPAGRCRVHEAAVMGHRAVVLENRWLRATVLPDRGALLHELLHKPSDTDLLWRWDRGLPDPARPAPSLALPQGGFQDAFVGGWDLMLPAVSRLRAGAGVGSHGETWALPWVAGIERDAPDGVRVALRTSCRRTPFDVVRTLELGEDPVLRCVTRVANRGSRPHPWAMGEHAVWDVATDAGGDGSDRAVRRAHARRPSSRTARCSRRGAATAWPLAATQDGTGTRDLSAIDASVLGSTGLAAVRVDAGEVALVGEGRPTVRLRWDREVLPHLLVWMPFGGDHGAPWFGTVRALGLEPVSVPPWTGARDLPELAAGAELVSTWEVALDHDLDSA